MRLITVQKGFFPSFLTGSFVSFLLQVWASDRDQNKGLQSQRSPRMISSILGSEGNRHKLSKASKENNVSFETRNLYCTSIQVKTWLSISER